MLGLKAWPGARPWCSLSFDCVFAFGMFFLKQLVKNVTPRRWEGSGALNAMGVKPRDLIQIMLTIKAAGALQAEIASL